MKIATILGTRPEIIKLSPLIHLLDREFTHIIIHTGQHYSYNMDQVFFEDLNLRNCNYDLNVGSGNHAKQTAEMMVRIEEVLFQEEPDLLVVHGDTNSTLAGAITASKLGIKVAHVEAGCRSFDKRMPEEVNRILVDHCSDYLFAPDKIALNNLIAEGISKKRIFVVGDTSADACSSVKGLFIPNKLNEYGLKKYDYALLTVHRRENTRYDNLTEILGAVNTISNEIKFLFPVHLRTKKLMDYHNLKTNQNVTLIDPVGYIDFIGLLENSKFVLTDSCGIQEEAAFLNVPCLILRENTEWQHLTETGKNILIGTNQGEIIDFVNGLLDDEQRLEYLRRLKSPIKEGASKAIFSILKGKLYLKI